MLTSKQRAYLRSLAVNLDTILMVGKSGMSPEIIKQAEDALNKRELIKGKVLVETSPMTPREAAEEIAEATNSEVVQVIGSKFCLYKKNLKEPKIELPRVRKAKKL
jgi:putative RNA-binding protein, YhbY family